MVIRIDGKGFTKFSSAHNFIKPNDTLALNLMNISAQHVIDTFPDIFLAYGQSDEYSFVLQRDTNLFSRRIDKIVSNIVSAFTSCYAFNFEKVMK
jgi:tRNA(His) guanylyltransferase